MPNRRSSGRQSYGTIILVALLLTSTGIALLHWHKDWAPQNCQLCHIRDLPSLHTHSAGDLTVSTLAAPQRPREGTPFYAGPRSLARASRAPPESIFIIITT